MPTWTAPKTFTSTVLPASDLNTYMSENLRVLDQHDHSGAAGHGAAAILGNLNGTAWRNWYTNSGGLFVPQAFGPAGAIWTSTGTASAPTWVAAGGPYVSLVASTTSLQELVSATGPGAVFSKTIGATWITVNGLMRLTALCDILNNTGSNQTLTFSPSLGGSSVMQWTVTIPTSTSRRAVLFEMWIGAASIGSSQRVVGHLVVGGTATAVAGTATNAAVVEDSILEDNANTQNLASGTVQLLILVGWSTASASLSFRLHTAHLEAVG